MVVSHAGRTPGSLLNQGGHSQSDTETISFTPSGVIRMRIRSRSIMEGIRRYPRALELVLIPWVLFGVFWFFLGKYMHGGHSRSFWVDNTYLIHPLFSFISKALSAGEYPYWIDSLLGGLPLYNSPQFSPLYPFYFLGWSLYQTPLDALLQVHYVTFLHVGILYLNTYVMLRIFHLPILPSIVGATCCAFSANTNTYDMWVNIIAPYSWLPLAIGSVFLIIENEYPRVGLLLGAISISLLTTASPSQPLIHFIYCAGVFVVSYWVLCLKETRIKLAVLRNLALATIACLLLTAPVLVPGFSSMKKMVRFVGKGGTINSDQHVPLASLVEGQYEPSELANVFFPLRRIHNGVGNSYLGILPVFLAFLGLLKARKNWIVLPLFLFGLYCLFSVTGIHLGVAYVNYYLPLWNKIREPDRHLVLFILFFATLCAFGFQFIWEWIKHEVSPSRKQLVVTVGAYLLLAFGAYSVRLEAGSRIPDLYLFGTFLLFVTLTIATYMLAAIRTAFFKVLLAGVTCYSSLLLPFDIPRFRESDYFQEPNLRSHRILAEISKINDIRDFRLVVDDQILSSQLWSMNAVYYGIRTFKCYMNPLPRNQWLEVYFALNTSNYSNLLGAKYYLCSSCAAAPAGYQLAKEIEGYKLYITDKVRSRYYWSVEMADSGQGLNFFDIIQKSDDYLTKVYVQPWEAKRVTDWLVTPPSNPRFEVLRELRSLNSLQLRVRTNSRGIFVLNEFFNKDWQLMLNGGRQSYLRVNRNQMGVLLPEGTNEISFEFHPKVFIRLLYVQRVCLILLVAWVIVLTIQNRFVLYEWCKQGVAL